MSSSSSKRSDSAGTLGSAAVKVALAAVALFPPEVVNAPTAIVFV